MQKTKFKLANSHKNQAAPPNKSKSYDKIAAPIGRSKLKFVFKPGYPALIVKFYLKLFFEFSYDFVFGFLKKSALFDLFIKFDSVKFQKAFDKNFMIDVVILYAAACDFNKLVRAKRLKKRGRRIGDRHKRAAFIVPAAVVA